MKFQPSSTEYDDDYYTTDSEESSQQITTTESSIISSKNQISERVIQDILEMQKNDSGETFRENLRKQKEEQLEVQQTEAERNYQIPLRVIIPVEHIELENEIPKDEKYLKYNYLVLKEDKPDFYGHLENDIPDPLIKNKDGSNEIFKSEDGLIKYEVANNFKTESKKIVELKPKFEHESFTPSPVPDDEFDSTEKESDMLVTLFYYVPWW